ncbi:MAG: 2-dehydropantoate 2-reductase, partial [Planctomycetota bacterium]
MKTLVVGAGAIGGVIASRLIAAGQVASVATRDRSAAEKLRQTGLRVTGIGGETHALVKGIAPLEDYLGTGDFDLVILATKAAEAIAISSKITTTLRGEGTLLPLQNGGVAFEISEQTGGHATLGGLSNIGATMHTPGVYEQRNGGHLLLGELVGGSSLRADRVGAYLADAIDVRVTTNFSGCVWSKLLVNCSVTTLGAVSGVTMRQYVQDPDCRRFLLAVYRETLGIALACGAHPERLLIDPNPVALTDEIDDGTAIQAWMNSVLDGYGDIKPSMLQDLERGRVTEIAHINGYVTRVAVSLGMPAPLNAS